MSGAKGPEVFTTGTRILNIEHRTVLCSNSMLIEHLYIEQ